MRTLAITLFLLLPILVVVAPPVPAATADAGWEVELLHPPVGATNPNARVFYRDIAWRPDGSYALVVGGIRGPSHNPCAGWSFVMSYTGASWEVLRNESGCMLFKAAWHPDGSHAILVGERDTILKFEADTKTFKDVWGLSSFATAGEHFLPRSVAYRPNGEYALITGNDLLRFYPTATTTAGAEVRDVLVPGAHGQGDFYDSVAWSPDGRYAIMEAGVTDANGTRALGAIVFYHTDAGACAKHGRSSAPCLYVTKLYGRMDPGFTDVDDITFGPIGKVAWIYGLDGGQGTLMRYGEAEDGFSFPYTWNHESGRTSSMAWQPNSFKVLYTGYGDEQLTLSQSWRFTPILTNAKCQELWPEWLDSCPNLKEAAWHPGGEWALVIGGTGWAFKFKPHLTPTVQIDAPVEGADVTGASLLVKGLALAQQTTRKVTDVQVRLDGGAWKPAGLGAAKSTGTPWNTTLDVSALEAGTRHTIEARASDDGGASWGALSSARFYVKDTTRRWGTLTLSAPDGTQVDNGFNLTWTTEGDATYVVERSREPTFITAETFLSEDPRVTFKWHVKGTWYFRVAARGGLNQGDWSNTVAIAVIYGPDRSTAYDPASGEIIPTFDDEDDGAPPVVKDDPPPANAPNGQNTPRPGFVIPAPAALAALAALAAVALMRRRS